MTARKEGREQGQERKEMGKEKDKGKRGEGRKEKENVTRDVCNSDKEINIFKTDTDALDVASSRIRARW